MFHIILSHLSVDERLGYFYILTAINDASMNKGLIYLFSSAFWISSDKYPEVELSEQLLSEWVS